MSDKMWKIIEQIDWPNNVNQSKAKVMRTFDKQDLLDLREFLGQMCYDLSERIRDYEHANGDIDRPYGGDSFSDMINHAVSMGKDYFNSVMENPTILSDLNYVESFSYIIPYGEDCYKELTPEYYVEQAKNCLDELEGIFGPVAIDLRNRFNMMIEGNFAGATNGWNKNMYDHYCNWSGNPAYALFSNILGDCYEYMVESVENV